MKYSDFKKLNLPNTPGVYFFVGPKDGAKERILYIGKATSLKDRVKSYFGDDILSTRGLHIANMVTLAETVLFTKTDSVLEALLLENRLIKKWKPKYNTKEKDDKSFNYVVITKEKFPRVLIIRGKNLNKKLPTTTYSLQTVFGPFPHGALLREAMKIIRKIFPYRDVCSPAIISQQTTAVLKSEVNNKSHSGIMDNLGKEIKAGEPCFNRQIGLCPGVCTGEISEKEYGKRIQELKFFFGGKKKEILHSLEKEMKKNAKEMQFEKASEIKKRIFVLNHIKDISLIKDIPRKFLTDKVFRIEAYDVAHISGTSRVGAMVVLQNREPAKNEYRKFKLRGKGLGDTDGLQEILSRRLNHSEWRYPDLIVVDGSIAQKRVAENIIKKSGHKIPVVAVVKNEKHKPERILGERSVVDNREKEILLKHNQEIQQIITGKEGITSNGERREGASGDIIQAAHGAHTQRIAHGDSAACTPRRKFR